jgi:hypothetical protein
MLTFMLDPNIIVIEYFLVYTLTNMFAEIGGYVGLLLGFSLFSAFDLYIVAAAYFKKKGNESHLGHT